MRNKNSIHNGPVDRRKINGYWKQRGIDKQLSVDIYDWISKLVNIKC